MPDMSAVQLVGELLERASPRPWKLDGIMIDAADGEFVFFPPPAECWENLTPEQRIANAALAALAVNTLPLVLKALEKEHGHTWHLQPGEHGVVDLTRYAAMGCHACAALATVAEAAQAALAGDVLQ